METFKLLEIWGQDDVQAQLNKSKRNSHVYDRIASEMKDSGFERGATQCSNKIKKLRQEYKKRKDDKNKSGASNLPWTFYEAIDSILGHRPATCPPVTIDSSRSAPTLDNSSVDDPEEEKVSDSPAAHPAIVLDSPDRDNPGTSQLDVSSDSAVVSSRMPAARVHSIPPTGPPPKKRKISKSEATVNAVQAVVDQLIVTQKESEKTFAQLEERRLDLDAKMLEMEKKRQEQEFLLMRQMMGMLSERIGQFPHPGGFMPPTAARAQQFPSHSPDQSAGHPMFQPFNRENFQ